MLLLADKDFEIVDWYTHVNRGKDEENNEDMENLTRELNL